MSKSLSKDIARKLSDLSKHQNLLVAFIVVGGLSLGVGLLIGQSWAQGNLPRPFASTYQRINVQPLSKASPSATPSPVLGASSQNNKTTNLNTANLLELDVLPGIGAVYAQKIITNRPYQAVNELITRKIIPLATYNKIKDQVSVQ